MADAPSLAWDDGRDGRDGTQRAQRLGHSGAKALTTSTGGSPAVKAVTHRRGRPAPPCPMAQTRPERGGGRLSLTRTGAAVLSFRLPLARLTVVSGFRLPFFAFQGTRFPPTKHRPVSGRASKRRRNFSFSSVHSMLWPSKPGPTMHVQFLCRY